MAVSLEMSSSSSSESCSDYTESDEDASSSDDHKLELTSWAKIYKSLKLLPTSSHSKDSKHRFIFYIADGADHHGDFVNALKLYSLGLSHFWKTWEHENSKAANLSTESGECVRRIPFDKRLLKNAVEGCLQNKDRLVSSKRLKCRIIAALDRILEYCDLLALMDCTLLQTFASLYFGLKEEQKAFQLSARAIKINTNSLSIQEMFENICCHLVERWHFVMLNDKDRNSAYKQAIEEGLRRMERKAVVCDVGCGTGILSLISCQQANSSQIFAIEKSASMCDVARSVFEANLDPTISEKIKLVNKMSSKMSVPQDMPQKADILVTETFDAGLFGEGILPTLCHAWANLLKTGAQERAQVIPGKAQLYLQAVECDVIRKESRFLGQFEGLTTSGLHISGSTGLCESDPYTAHDVSCLPGGYRTLSEPVKLMDVNFNDSQELGHLNKGIIRETVLEIAANGRLDAMCVWFSLYLDDSTVISTHIGSHNCWDQAVFAVHPVKIQAHPISRGSVFDMRVRPGDVLKVVHAVVGAKLSVDVVSVSSPDEASIYSNTTIPQFLSDADVLWRHSVFCLPNQELKVLNNAVLQSAQYRRVHELLDVVRRDNSEVDFFHMNEGFSPLCLQALNLGFHRAVISVHSQQQAALLQKMAALNNIDMRKVHLFDDVCCRETPQSKGDGSRSGDASGLNAGDWDKTELPGNKAARPPALSDTAAVVLCDLVDPHGRLVEGLLEQQEVLRNQLSKYRTATVAPYSLDVYGLLVDSEQLLRFSRVQSDENTLGFNISSFVNKYTTRNHQDIALTSLQHTKLSEPFKMFTVNTCKMLDLPERTPKRDQTLTSKKPSNVIIPESAAEKLIPCFKNNLSASLFHSESNHERVLPESKLISEFNPNSTNPEDNPTKQIDASSPCDFQTHKPCQRYSHPHFPPSSVNKEQNILVTSQSVSLSLDEQEFSISQSNILPPVTIDVGNTSTEIRSPGELRTQRLIVKGDAEETSCGGLHFGEENRQCSPKCSSPHEDGGDEERETSSGRKRRRLVNADVDYDAFPEYGVDEEGGELVQSVHLQVPVIDSGVVTAMVYWFELHFSPTYSVRTIDPSHHWNQAAVMTLPSQSQRVVTGDVLGLFCQINGSAISFMIE